MPGLDCSFILRFESLLRKLLPFAGERPHELPNGLDTLVCFIPIKLISGFTIPKKPASVRRDFFVFTAESVIVFISVRNITDLINLAESWQLLQADFVFRLNDWACFSAVQSAWFLTSLL